ncbi:class I SAM-dependent methyltransferase [Jatrophihabitans cynanchi]|uniref:Class I SAM-dependent methyltransferase n=1 Tax=Jatrophihabitans cynanchi TaxID=2944128 RepID=A0ABY7JUL2_9ACTN|nr:class I SAM-dependent methyltransferase [Jatrophihabitans sp. SB3-54]WAX56028.1 class I SAM-dependent methyltransferase [Jatrophihabitans sp. SB3-54]
MISTAQVRRIGFGASGVLSVLAAVFAAIGNARVALTLLSLAVAAFVVALWTSTRTVINRLVVFERHVSRSLTGAGGRGSRQPDPQRLLDALERIGTQLNDLPIVAQQSVVATETLGRLLEARASATEAAGTRHRSVLHRLDQVETQLQQAPGLTVEMARLAERLGVGPGSLPLPGGWALTGQTLLALVDEVLSSTRENIVECGCGTSTVWIALALRHRGTGHVFALEHEVRFAGLARDQLRAHGLEQWATVIDAPLADTVIEGESVQWYDLAALDLLPDRIDLLFVDGPPGDTGRLARRPAYVLLQSRLYDDSVVVLDDTNRPAEKEISEDWLSRSTPHGHLIERAKIGRSTFYDMRAPAQES